MMATRDYHAERCCCGRIEDWTEPLILGERLHERLGDEGAFCGPVLHHDLRDQEQEIERLRKALMWAFDRADIDGGMTAAECKNTAEEIGKVLAGKQSVAARYVPNEWDASAKLSDSGRSDGGEKT